MTLISDMFAALGNASSGERLLIRDPELLQSKLSAFLKCGLDGLQVVCDFDMTLSKYQHNGSKSPVSHAILFMSPAIPPETLSKFMQFVDYYTPIEKNPNMKPVDKCPFMVEFWQLAHKTLIDCGVHRSDLEPVMKNDEIVLREQTAQLLHMLHQHGVPVLVFSAGVGDVIQTVLTESGAYFNNVKIIANFMQFDADGKLTSFSEPLIHSYNKTVSHVLPAAQYARSNSERTCVLLLGDSLNDAAMLDDLEKATDQESPTILRIGFLNEPSEMLKDKYTSLYDIVLLEDDTLAVPLRIVEAVAGNCHATQTTSNTG